MRSLNLKRNYVRLILKTAMSQQFCWKYPKWEKMVHIFTFWLGHHRHWDKACVGCPHGMYYSTHTYLHKIWGLISGIWYIKIVKLGNYRREWAFWIKIFDGLINWGLILGVWNNINAKLGDRIGEKEAKSFPEKCHTFFDFNFNVDYIWFCY